MTAFALSLGANLDDREAALQGAVDALAASPGITVAGVSSLYETEPVGGPEQPSYLNAVVIGQTTCSPAELLAIIQEIEMQWLRTREVRWGPRTLDIDIITMGDERVSTPDLSVPHPLAHVRAFVCVPLLEADPEARIGDRVVDDIVSELDIRGVRRVSDRFLVIPRVSA